MSYQIGQRLGRLTVTQVRLRAAEQVRCDCGTTIDVWLEFDFLAPPDEIGHYHAPWLLMAEAGRLRYDTVQYRIHGVPNNAADARWRGLLVDAPDGPVLTELGAHMLAHWKEQQPAQRQPEEPDTTPAAAHTPPQPPPAQPRPDDGGATQLDLGLFEDEHAPAPGQPTPRKESLR